jgi:hypothetical protein
MNLGIAIAGVLVVIILIMYVVEEIQYQNRIIKFLDNENKKKKG